MGSLGWDEDEIYVVPYMMSESWLDWWGVYGEGVGSVLGER